MVLRKSIYQNSNVGLYGLATDKYAILGMNVPKTTVKNLEKSFGVDIIQTPLCGTNLIGIFAAGNNKTLLLPSIVMESELKKLNNFEIIETNHTALGNNIVANNKACLISPELKEHKQTIKKALEVEKIEEFSIQDITTIGSLIVLNKKGCLVSAIANEQETEFVKKFFQLPVTQTTVNLGSPYIRSGIVANTKSFWVGAQTTGVETNLIEEGLGFLRKS